MMFVRHGPVWFRIVAIVLIVWGLMGCFACIQQIRLGADAMGPASAYDRALHASLPSSYNAVYAVAVGAGLVGAVLLYRRQVAARRVFIVSLVAVIVQFGWLFASTDIIAAKGAARVMPFPVFIVAVAAFSVWLTGHARRKGWIA